MPDEKDKNQRKFARDRANAIFESHGNDQNSLLNGRPRRGAHVMQMGQGIDAKHSQMKGATSMHEIMQQQHAGKPDSHSHSQVNRNDDNATGSPRSAVTITLGKSQNTGKSSSFFQSFVAKQNQKHTVGRAFSLLDKTQSIFNFGGDAAKKGFAQLQNMRTQNRQTDDESGREQLKPFFDPDNNQQKLRIEIAKKHTGVDSDDERRSENTSQPNPNTNSNIDNGESFGFFQQKPMAEEAFLKTDKGKAVQGFAKELINFAEKRQQATGNNRSPSPSPKSAPEQRIKSTVKTNKDGSKAQTVTIQKAGKPDMNSLLQLGMLATKGAASVSGLDDKQSAKLNNQMQKLGGLLGTAQKLGIFNNQPKPQKLTISVQQKAQQKEQQAQSRSRSNAITEAPKPTTQPKTK